MISLLVGDCVASSCCARFRPLCWVRLDCAHHGSAGEPRGLALRTARKNILGIEMFRGLAARIMPTLVAART